MSAYKKPGHLTEPCWQALIEHQKKIFGTSLKEMFKQKQERAETLSYEFNGLYVDYSKHLITQETVKLLMSMAQNSNLTGAIQQLFSGATINQTENIAAMHMALRTSVNEPYYANGENITELVHNELKRIQEFIEQLHNGGIKGYSGKSIETVINIGVGGSDIGPGLVTTALTDFSVSDIVIHFVSNVDFSDINSALEKSAPETTLFIISSKSFTTRETLLNATTATKWLKENGCTAPDKHILAVTANHDKAITFGVKDENIFHIWEWIGGRYSVWSAIGLPIAIKIGMRNFHDFLKGASAMDQHFREQSLENNLPVILGLIDIWYANFFHTETLAIFPYDHSLNMLPAYVGQLIMESNGKHIDNDGKKIEYNTAPIVWGGIGSNSQHSCFQCLHQGTHMTPVDFIVSLMSTLGNKKHHKELVANCLAQSEALMSGAMASTESAYKNIPGNHPSTTIVLDELSPTTLGTLLCLYEHRCFVQSQLWNINPFDQWGVELGKNLAKNILEEMDGNINTSSHDPSTNRLISRYIAKNNISQKD